MKYIISLIFTFFLAFNALAEAEKAVELKADEKITVTGNDAMKFSTNEIKVKAGSSVSITFKNIGKLPKIAMGHNFVILQKGSDIAKFCQEAMKFASNEYIPTTEAFKKQIIVHSKLLGPGEKDTIIFKVPKEKGDYPYVCSFPGHYAVMKGIIKVE